MSLCSTKVCSVGREGGPQFAVVVDLAIEGEDATGVGRDHRLASTGEIDDGQPAVRETGRAISPDPAAVWTTVRHGLGHALEGRPVDGPRVGVNNSGNAAHSEGDR